MSENAIDMRAATDTPNPQIDDEQMSGRRDGRGVGAQSSARTERAANNFVDGASYFP